MRANNTRDAVLAEMVNVSSPLPPLTWAVSLPSPPSNRSLPVARIPDHPVVAGLAEHLVAPGATDQHIVAVAAEQQIIAALAKDRVVAGLTEQQVVARPSGDRVVAVTAEQFRGGERAVGFVQFDRVVASLSECLDYGWKRPPRRRAAGNRDAAIIGENVPCWVAAEFDSVLAAGPGRGEQAVGGREVSWRSPLLLSSRWS